MRRLSRRDRRRGVYIVLIPERLAGRFHGDLKIDRIREIGFDVSDLAQLAIIDAIRISFSRAAVICRDGDGQAFCVAHGGALTYRARQPCGAPPKWH